MHKLSVIFDLCILLLSFHNCVFSTEDLLEPKEFEKQNENEHFTIETAPDTESTSNEEQNNDQIETEKQNENEHFTIETVPDIESTSNEEQNNDQTQTESIDNSNVDGSSSVETFPVPADGNNTTNGTSEGNSTKVNCVLRILSGGEVPQVRVMNLSALSKALTPVPNITDGECAVVLFYSPWCVFSARAAPHFNALARVFPHISFYAIDAVQHTTLHMRYGLIAVPTILFFQNGRAVAKFNGSHANLERFANFVNGFTGISPDGALNVTSADMTGPVPATLQERIDYILLLSWTFTIVSLCIWFLKSSFCHRIVESIQNTWREAEAQHEHEE